MLTDHPALADLSLLDPAVQDDPFEMYAAMQEEPGIYQMPKRASSSFRAMPIFARC